MAIFLSFIHSSGSTSSYTTVDRRVGKLRCLPSHTFYLNTQHQTKHT